MKSWLFYGIPTEIQDKQNKVCGTSYSTMKNIERIHGLLTPEAAKIIVSWLGHQ